MLKLRRFIKVLSLEFPSCLLEMCKNLYSSKLDIKVSHKQPTFYYGLLRFVAPSQLPAKGITPEYSAGEFEEIQTCSKF